MDKIRWGILGTGYIAGLFAEGLTALDDATLTAVGSRGQDSADSFGAKWVVPHRYGSYEALANDPDVDAIYIATPHPYHYENTLLCLNAGKHVLVEKPFAMNARQTKGMIDLARQKGLFLMEAMWTRYLPQMDVARQLIADGAIGEPRLLVADFGQDNRALARIWDRGDGSPLWDMGIYPVALAQMIFGSPTHVAAHGIVLDTGVDAESTSYLSYPSGARATFTVSGVVATLGHATLAGEDGVLELGAPFLFPTGVGLAKKGLEAPMEWWRDESGLRQHAGLAYQVTAFADYVQRGLVESPLQSHADSLECLRVTADIVSALGADPYE